MKKHVFYHLLAKNDYIRTHNHLMSQVLSNPFFDDALFSCSLVGENNPRLIWPQNTNITQVKDVGSERPAFELMKQQVAAGQVQPDDLIFYFHCKGTSRTCVRTHKEKQETLMAVEAVKHWNAALSFFLITKVEQYLDYLRKYGTLCIYPVRHLFGESHRAGTLGNFWWCTGDVLQQITNLSFENKHRHYFETTFLGDLLNRSSRPYKTAFYIHDGNLCTYEPDSITIRDMVGGYWTTELLELINMDFPYTPEAPAVGVVMNAQAILPVETVTTVLTKFANNQRFKNFWITTFHPGVTFEKTGKILHFNDTKPPLIRITTSYEKLRAFCEPRYYYVLDDIAKCYKNDEFNFDGKKYVERRIKDFTITPVRVNEGLTNDLPDCKAPI